MTPTTPTPVLVLLLKEIASTPISSFNANALREAAARIETLERELATLSRPVVGELPEGGTQAEQVARIAKPEHLGSFLTTAEGLTALGEGPVTLRKVEVATLCDAVRRLSSPAPGTPEQVEGQTKFPHNPAHPIGTCGDCGEEMVYNVPRLGPSGGFVHRNGVLTCVTRPEPSPMKGEGAGEDDDGLGVVEAQRHLLKEHAESECLLCACAVSPEHLASLLALRDATTPQEWTAETIKDAPEGEYQVEYYTNHTNDIDCEWSSVLQPLSEVKSSMLSGRSGKPCVRRAFGPTPQPPVNHKGETPTAGETT